MFEMEMWILYIQAYYTDTIIMTVWISIYHPLLWYYTKMDSKEMGELIIKNRIFYFSVQKWRNHMVDGFIKATKIILGFP